MDLLITTILKRPYVFMFLAAYIFLAWRRWGWRRAILWLVSGYAIAWASEYSSIHNGFPYGEYHYKYENLQGELMVFGVPFFDSLSYPFLIFAGFTAAKYVIKGFSPTTSFSVLKTASAAAFFTMMLDVIIDPVAKLGSHWFLGDIYYYAEKGLYFNVPFTNFVGWFLVPLAVVLFNMTFWRRMPDTFGISDIPISRKEGIIYPLFYLAIALFNIAISFWIGAVSLGLASSFIFLVIATAVFLAKKRQISY